MFFFSWIKTRDTSRRSWKKFERNIARDTDVDRFRTLHPNIKSILEKLIPFGDIQYYTWYTLAKKISF